ncbi:hypothetical protein VSP10_12325 [Myroides odoratimimus]|uniref:Addiction module component n=1 Tax=Myroides odoratimimus CIP 101113 TaxID=883154 RepID=A0AAV3F1J7_9FLAO|nr:hypothetical protein [Myroides odoratimimus]EHO09604.1 hypothetical protein HMPREF9715_02448 [Myroides odoratimimus CIP 101113]MEC4053572.1 hypothetical protein [Myroides odoratimimus]
MVNSTLQSEREELINSLLQVKDISLIRRIREILRHDEQLPAVMSVEELRKEVLLGVEEVRSGYGIKQKDFFEEMDKW